MKIKFLFIFFISLFAIKLSNAHALWIETEAKGTINQTHSLKVFYGEYAEGLIDPIDKWYSNVKDFEIVLISPTGMKKTLDKTAAGDHYNSEFTATEKGTYTISITQPAKEPYETMRFEFSSIAFVTVSEQKTAKLDIPFYVEAKTDGVKSGSEVEITVYSKGNIAPDTEVIIMGPEGWTKTVSSDSNGKAKFKAITSGKYIIEASSTEEKTEEWEGKKIEKIWRGTTTALFIK